MLDIFPYRLYQLSYLLSPAYQDVAFYEQML